MTLQLSNRGVFSVKYVSEKASDSDGVLVLSGKPD